MIGRLESWSPWAERRGAAATAAVSLSVFFVAWGVLHHGFYAEDQIRDTGHYHRYGAAMAGGQVPYRDFDLEYPPGSLPVFLLPALGNGGEGEPQFRDRFEWLMLGCGAAAIALMALTLAGLGGYGVRLPAALGFAALAPLALGSVVLSRFDLWPAAVTTAALAALVLGRQRVGFAALALGAAAKVYPAVLLPLAVAHVWRRQGRREAFVCTAIFAGVVAALVVPFVLVAPGGVTDAISRQLGRPLQVESLGAAALVVVHHLAGFDVTVRSGAGSQNLVGDVPAAVASVQTVIQGGVLLAIWVWFARGRACDSERLVRGAAAAVCAFAALGKVLSPQFLIWLVPLVPLVRGRRGLAASALLGLALVLTQLWFPYRYWDYALALDEGVAWLVLARDVALIGVLAVLLWPEGRGTVRRVSEVARGIAAMGWQTSDGQPITREPPFGVSVLVWRPSEQGPEWLVLHRAHEGPDYEGEWAWGPPAGARHPGEPLDACARRELLEETGLALELRRTDCGTADWAVFVAEAPPDCSVVVSAEHDAFRWLPVDEAAGRCLPAQVGDSIKAAAATLPA